jgi:DNA polymerase III subunit epsilon
LEIAWFTADGSSQCSAMQTYLVKQPDDADIPYRIKSLTGIRQEEMERAISKEEARELLARSLQSIDQPNICLAHYARFEMPFLQDLLQPASSSLPFDLICSFEIARRLFPNLPSRGIRAVAGYFGTGCSELKRADSHATATLAIWQGLQPHLSDLGLSSMEDLIRWIQKPPESKRTKYEYPLSRSKRLELPDVPGVYRMLSKNNAILYVGKATSLKQRVNSYFRGQTGKDSKTRELLSQVWDLSHTECTTALEAALLEADEIKRWDPPYNRALKRRERELVFYSRDLSSSSRSQDEMHVLGPFASTQVVAPLTKLDQSLRDNAFVTDIFFSQLPQVLLREGFELFCINESIERTEIRDSRSLLALGLYLYRQKIRQEKEQPREPEDDVERGEDTPLSSSLSPDVRTQSSVSTSSGTPEAPRAPSSSQTSTSFTAEEVSARFARLLRRIARQYLRAKSMTKLLHARVDYRQNNLDRSFILSNGTIVHESGNLTGTAQASPVPWSDLDIDTYDRMSVLLTELGKLQTQSGSSASQRT